MRRGCDTDAPFLAETTDWRSPERVRALLVASICGIEQRDLGPENVSYSHPFARWNQPNRLDRAARDLAAAGATFATAGIELAESLGMTWQAAIARVSLAVARAQSDHLDEALELAMSGLAEIGADVGHWPATAAMIEVANIHVAAQQDEGAAAWATRARVRAREAGDSNLVLWAHDTLARLARSQGDFAGAAGIYAAALGGRDASEGARLPTHLPGGSLPGRRVLCRGSRGPAQADCHRPGDRGKPPGPRRGRVEGCVSWEPDGLLDS